MEKSHTQSKMDSQFKYQRKLKNIICHPIKLFKAHTILYIT